MAPCRGERRQAGGGGVGQRQHQLALAKSVDLAPSGLCCAGEAGGGSVAGTAVRAPYHYKVSPVVE